MLRRFNELRSLLATPLGLTGTSSTDRARLKNRNKKAASWEECRNDILSRYQDKFVDPTWERNNPHPLRLSYLKLYLTFKQWRPNLRQGFPALLVRRIISILKFLQCLHREISLTHVIGMVWGSQHIDQTPRTPTLARGISRFSQPETGRSDIIRGP